MNLKFFYSAALLIVSTAATAWAADLYWDGSVGDSFNDGNNWGGAVPGLEDTAIVDVDGTVEIFGAQTVGNIYVGTATGNAIISQQAGEVVTGTLFLGQKTSNGDGTYTDVAGTRGQYLLSGGTLTVQGGIGSLGGVFTTANVTGGAILLRETTTTIKGTLTSSSTGDHNFAVLNGTFALDSGAQVLYTGGRLNLLGTAAVTLNPGAILDVKQIRNANTNNIAATQDSANWSITNNGGLVTVHDNSYFGHSGSTFTGTFTNGAEFRVVGDSNPVTADSPNGANAIGFGNDANSKGTLSFTDSSFNVALGEQLRIGDGNDTVSKVTFTRSTLDAVGKREGIRLFTGTNAQGTLSLTDSAWNVTATAQEVRLIQGTNASGTVTLNNSSYTATTVVNTQNNNFIVGTGVNGTATLTNNSEIRLKSGNLVQIGTEGTAVANITVNDTSRFIIDAANGAKFATGGNGGQTFNLTLNGSSLFDIISPTGTTIILDGQPAAPSVNIKLNDASIFRSAGQVTLGQYNKINIGDLVVDVNGTATFQAETLVLGRQDTNGNSPRVTINLTGGTLAVGSLRAGGSYTDVRGSAQDHGGAEFIYTAKSINVDGGTIKALQSDENFIGWQGGRKGDQEGHGIQINVLGGGLTIDTQEFNVLVDDGGHAFLGTGAITKTGTGTLRINATVAPDLTVAAGTLGGNGTFGNITVESGATLSPGNSIGTLTATGSVTFASGATLVIEYDGAQTNLVDALDAASVVFNDGAILNVVIADPANLAAGAILDVFNGTVVNLTGVTINSSDPAYSFVLSVDGKGLQVAAVPEPSTYALLAGVVLLSGVAWRRRRKG